MPNEDKPESKMLSEKVPANGTRFDVIDLLKAHSVAIESPFRYAGIIPDVEFGTGFFVDSGKPGKCDILADNHVMRSDTANVILPDGSTHPAKVIARDLPHDMALIEADGVANPRSTCESLPLAKTDEPNSKDFTAIKMKRDQMPGFFEVLGLASPPTKVDILTKSWTGNSLNPISRGSVRTDRILDGESMKRVFQVFAMTGEAGESGGAVVNAEGQVSSQVEGGNRSTLGSSVDDIRAFLDKQKQKP